MKTKKIFQTEAPAICGTRKAPKREKAIAQDFEIKPYIRAARTSRNLPDDTQTDTKWIVKPKSWKDRVRKRKQWGDGYV